MKFKIFILLFSLFVSSAVAQQATCDFANRNVGGVAGYSCGLILNNPEGLEITEVGGTHLEGFSDADVVSVTRLNGTMGAAYPSLFCERFPNLQSIVVSFAQVTAIDGAFGGCSQLSYLAMLYNNISHIDENTFANNPLLAFIDLDSNWIAGLPDGVFAAQTNLVSLDIRNNPFGEIPAGAFRGLTSLLSLFLQMTQITAVNPAWFEDTPNLLALYLNFNSIEDLPTGAFAQLPNLRTLNLWDNQLKTLRRDHFGADISQLETMDLDDNFINSMERSVFEEATNFRTLLFSRNLCANGYFSGFQTNRDQQMQQLERCFRNFDLVVDTVTDNNVEYAFFPGEWPGIVMRVQAQDEIQIALTPFDVVWNPMLEIIIGAGNNTRTVIRRNQEEDVAVIPTPGIIRVDEQNVFRIVWANNVVLAFRDNEEWPFIVYTMVDMVPVNFYGLRTPQSRAVWSIQPIGF